MKIAFHFIMREDKDNEYRIVMSQPTDDPQLNDIWTKSSLEYFLRENDRIYEDEGSVRPPTVKGKPNNKWDCHQKDKKDRIEQTSTVFFNSGRKQFDTTFHFR